MKNPVKLAVSILSSSFILGTLFYFFFVGRYVGLSLFLYTTLSFIVIKSIQFLRAREINFKLKDLYYIPIFLVSTIPFLAQNTFLTVLSVLFVLSFGIYTTLYTVFDFSKFDFTGYNARITKFAFAQFLYVAKPFQIADKKLQEEDIFRNKDFRMIVKGIAGFIVAIPILLLFIALFAAADAAFAEVTEDFFDILRSIFAFDSLGDLLPIAFFSILWLGSLSMIFLRGKKEVAKEIREGKSRVVDPIISNVVSICINLLFFLFACVQIVYLFDGRDRVVKLGVTYAEYARRGFGELLVVAFLSLVLVYSLRQFTNRKSVILGHVLKASLLAQVALTFMVLISSFHRMNIYNNGYGLTLTRFFVYAFLYLLALILFYFIGAIYNEKMFKNIFTFVFVSLSSVMFIAAVINPDAYVAKNNIQGYLDGSIEVDYLDTSYIIRSTSSDGFGHLITNEEIRDELECYQIRDINNKLDKEDNNRNNLFSFNLYRTLHKNSIEDDIVEDLSCPYPRGDYYYDSKYNDDYYYNEEYLQD